MVVSDRSINQTVLTVVGGLCWEEWKQLPFCRRHPLANFVHTLLCRLLLSWLLLVLHATQIAVSSNCNQSCPSKIVFFAINLQTQILIILFVIKRFLFVLKSSYRCLSISHCDELSSPVSCVCFRGEVVFKIHYLMLVLLYVKAVALFFHSVSRTHRSRITMLICCCCCCCCCCWQIFLLHLGATVNLSLKANLMKLTFVL